ncbi:MAG: ribonuclease P protein component [Chthoniobacterales bacterium]
MTAAQKFRFGRERRLTSSAEFARVREEGRTERGALLMLGALDLADASPFRTGLVTSKRLGGAVVRNRVRRRLREIVRRHQHEMRRGIWFVIIARPAAARASYAALEDEYLRLAKRAPILAP